MKRTAFLARMALVAACGGGSDSTTPPPPVPVASVGVDPSSASLLVGATTTVTATPRDASGTTLSGRANTPGPDFAPAVSPDGERLSNRGSYRFHERTLAPVLEEARRRAAG